MKTFYITALLFCLAKGLSAQEAKIAPLNAKQSLEKLQLNQTQLQQVKGLMQQYHQLELTLLKNAALSPMLKRQQLAKLGIQHMVKLDSLIGPAKAAQLRQYQQAFRQSSIANTPTPLAISDHEK